MGSVLASLEAVKIFEGGMGAVSGPHKIKALEALIPLCNPVSFTAPTGELGEGSRG